MNSGTGTYNAGISKAFDQSGVSRRLLQVNYWRLNWTEWAWLLGTLGNRDLKRET
ncbi:hypothetical protein MGG_17520 [Pyricularia oryzae 70-15]|uniref:Uncharacterized protein n=1 Tax=Pyricularia oryzae (strain 70-15 / ATCC MYA-4617 / FGSC 8958) TaxID=242507 RepID=G4NDY3_PYRO7|nr:uncharacterized protein MGG_17520 [Pyricularia oryzae 70-15]EHA49365.1 hypothetical protein MGG_17520 [Pyricularia oryzae 70-15]